ncbi:regulatory protein RecX [Cohnella luojiensis]|uniref:Regulatory protein RecX n=1 Tax=Cohnella luojiensis TaxID=652876 RepID=A0A4Y8LNN2_9BACL|nr:regulatory protein RecX [Cohnella luojiensis]TFE19808.1 regulatory protein RecX [Cohnella luojiensis]
MYKPKRGRYGSANGKASSGRTGKPSPSTNTGGNPLGLPVLGALVTGMEADSKRPHMYRIALELQLDETSTVDFDDDKLRETEPMADWNDEVDALIAGAQSTHGEGESLLTVHEDTLVSLRLLKGRRLTAEEYETLKKDEQKEEAYRSALIMLERKARTTSELSKSLKIKGYAPEVVEACLERLQARRMIDDTAYAKRFTEQRAVGQRKGRMLIRQELLQRGVGREDVEQALGELDGEVEQDSALALARKRWPSIKGNDRERKQKLMAVLMRRGFPSGIARTAVQQAAADSGERDPDLFYAEEDAFVDEYMED